MERTFSLYSVYSRVLCQIELGYVLYTRPRFRSSVGLWLAPGPHCNLSPALPSSKSVLSIVSCSILTETREPGSRIGLTFCSLSMSSSCFLLKLIGKVLFYVNIWWVSLCYQFLINSYFNLCSTHSCCSDVTAQFLSRNGAD